ncbi:uncharacterized protein BDZ99DRAFT_480896 [Mytilinidion resinicola]|uniref:Uncharacterized protein n=1 Tax=Mytilinidion resinicola TaxID=574789 RepID=A0A6A6Y8K8_9PEZI|nr:uncharacterized protein BDZ99DRAFT_480896 [Mytilinidion resinicola]KAF2804893.1 hypothetical protein BDZ99DRAFT_480896 [Mytilinidion resinicola]
MTGSGAVDGMADGPDDDDIEEVPREDIYNCDTPHGQQENTAPLPSKRKASTSTPPTSTSAFTGLDIIAPQGRMKGAPSNKRPCSSGISATSDSNDRTVVDEKALRSQDPDTSSRTPPDLKKGIQHKATAASQNIFGLEYHNADGKDSGNLVETCAAKDMADQHQLIELTTVLRDIAFSFLEHRTSKDRKADAMKFRQLLGEIGVMEPRVHDAVVAGYETTFLSLPREIRDEIYKLSLVAVVKDQQPRISFDRLTPERLKILKARKGGLIPFSNSTLLRERGIVVNLLHTSRQVKLEAEEIFYKYNGFSFPYRFHKEIDDGCSLQMFHLILSSSAFANIRSLKLGLSTLDGPRWEEKYPKHPQALKSAELDYLKEIDPQHRIEYAQICHTRDGIVADRNLWLFATWVNKLDHVFKMPALKDLTIAMREMDLWIYDDRDIPGINPRRAATQVLLTRMRDRKKSGLGCILVSVDGGVKLFEMPGLWKPVQRGHISLEATTEDCDLNYSVDKDWSHSDLTESEGLSWIGTPRPINDVTLHRNGERFSWHYRTSQQ